MNKVNLMENTNVDKSVKEPLIDDDDDVYKVKADIKKLKELKEANDIITKYDEESIDESESTCSYICYGILRVLNIFKMIALIFGIC